MEEGSGSPKTICGKPHKDVTSSHETKLPTAACRSILFASGSIARSPPYLAIPVSFNDQWREISTDRQGHGNEEENQRSGMGSRNLE